MSETLTIRKPDDFHVHFREGPMLPEVVPYTTAQFARALAMPNPEPPIIDGDTVAAYRMKILANVPGDVSFQPLMTFKITPQTTYDNVVSAKHAGAIAGKLYPDGVTTNSAGGVRDFRAVYPIFSLMEGLDLVLSLHGEHPDAECMDRERRFIRDVFYDIVRSFPNLRIVLEHISTEAGVRAVQICDSPLVAGTITTHHLELTHTDIFGGLLKPHLFCKPIPKWNRDRAALLGAAISGHPQFFFGSDSAPHPRNRKESAAGCAGVFSAPVALPVLAGIFERLGYLDRMEAFVSKFGAEFYQLPLNQDQITLVREEWTVPETCSGIVPYHAGEVLSWSLSG